MILCVVGPTGVGKTKLSIELAKKYHAVVLNADAMQVYQGLNIGTAKITEEEKEGIAHYLFDFVPVTRNYTVYDYQKDARKLLNEFRDQNIVLVGGSGLYLRALLYDYQFSEEEKKDYQGYTNEELYDLCLKKDASCLVHPNNRRRLIRFLQRKNEVGDAKPLYPFLMIGLTMDREQLYQTINQRVDQMMQMGLLEEVQSFYEQKIQSKALDTAIGYKEFYPYFEGKCSLDEVIQKIKQNSRHYAKRQYTFFKHQLPVHWFSVDKENFAKTVDEVTQFIEENS